MTYYDEELDYTYQNCKLCEHKREVIATAQDLLKKLVKQLYIPGEFKKDEFESILDELCSYLRVEIQYLPLQIEQIQPKAEIISIENLNKCA